MAVASPGGGQLAWVAAGVHTPSWPSGTAVGDVVLAWCDWELRRSPLGPRQDGWHPTGLDVWWRKLDAAAFAAGPGTWNGRLLGMVKVSGARGVGRSSLDRGLTLSEAGSGMLVCGWTGLWSDDELGYPASGMLGDDIEIAEEQWVAWWLRLYAAAGAQRIERDGDAVGYRAFEILPARQPDPPLISAPVSGAHLDVAQDVSVSIIHQSVAGLSQEARRLRVKLTSSGTWSYVKADGTVDAAVQTVTTSSGVASITGLAAGQYDVSAATSEAAVWSEWSPSSQFVLESAPSVAATFTTTHNDLTPSVSWTPTTPGGVQSAWRGAVVPDGGTMADALTVTPWHQGAGTSWSVPVLGWVKDGDYVAWIQVEQTGGLQSPWTSSTADAITWDAPDAPTGIAVTDGSPLTVQVTGIPAESVAVSLEWAPALADEWTALAMVEGPVDQCTVDVPLAPYGTGRRYRARSWEVLDGVWLPSAYVTSAAVASTDLETRLVSAEDSTEWLLVWLVGIGATTLEQGVSVSYGLAPDGVDAEAVRPMVDRTPTAGRSGSLVVETHDGSSLDELVEWLSTRESWWLRRTPERDGDGVLRDVPAALMTIADKVGWSRQEQTNVSRDSVTIPWVEQ